MKKKLSLTVLLNNCRYLFYVLFLFSLKVSSQMCTANGGDISITGSGATAMTICAGDGTDDPIAVSLSGTATGDNTGWVITDQATGEILGLPAAPPFNLEGAGPGICDIWYIAYADGLTGLSMGQNIDDLSGCFDLSNPIVVTRNGVNGGEIAITGTEATAMTICAGDGTDDPIAVSLSGTTTGDNTGWVITDQETGEILGLPAAPPFNLEGAGPGICDIWYIAYADGLTGLEMNANIENLSGCYDLSNPITVTRNGVNGGEIAITGTEATAMTICAGDGTDDPIAVSLSGTTTGDNTGWVITDQATGEILGLPAAPPFNLEGAGPGICDIWYIAYADGLTGLEMNANIEDLSGCYDLSNPIVVTRNGVNGGDISITGSEATAMTICAGDGTDDPIAVSLSGTATGDNTGWVITDQATGEILGLPAAPPFNLEGAGPGICDIWYIAYADGLTGLEMNANIEDLSGCYDLSNPITVTRNGVNGGEIAITGTEATAMTICAGDGTDDPIAVSLSGTATGANTGWVITDQATGEILGLPAAPPFNLEGAGPGICDIWYIAYADGLTGLSMGQNIDNLSGCFDLSNPIVVTRNGVNGGDISITGSGETAMTICAGDGTDDPIAVSLSGTATGDNTGWVITDQATGEILGLPAAPPFNLEGAGAGVCDIWYIAYADGLTGLEMNANIEDLSGCYDLSNPIVVTRLSGADCQTLSSNDLDVALGVAVFPNPVKDIISITYRNNQSVEFDVQIIDMLGKQVLNKKISNRNDARLNLSRLTVGTYFLSITDAITGRNFVKRIVKD